MGIERNAFLDTAQARRPAMSSIGFGGYGSPFVSGAAGIPAAQPQGSQNQRATASSDANRDLSIAQLNEKSIGDLAENHGVDDRDADGRMPWTANEEPPVEQPEASESQQPIHKPPLHPLDADGERGTLFDSDA